MKTESRLLGRNSNLEYKTFDFVVQKLETKDGIVDDRFSGLATTPAIDTYKDVVEPGAADKSIQKRFVQAIKNYGHPDMKIYRAHAALCGYLLHIEQRGPNIYIEWKFINTRLGRDTHEEVITGAVNKLSIGFRTIKEERVDRDGVSVRLLQEIDILEISLVDFPANIECEVFQKTDDESEVDAMNLAAEWKKMLDRAAEVTALQVKSDSIPTQEERSVLLKLASIIDIALKGTASDADDEKAAKPKPKSVTKPETPDDEDAPDGEPKADGHIGQCHNCGDQNCKGCSKKSDDLQKTLDTLTTALNGRIDSALQEVSEATKWAKDARVQMEVKNGR